MEPRSLQARIAAADRRGLAELVREHVATLREADLLRVLRHPYAGLEVIEEVLGVKAFLAVRSVRRALALHPATPRPDALRCLEDLPWRDLLDVARERRTPPPVRQAANRRLLDLLRKLSKGEKVALTRFADRDLFATLLDDPDPDVTATLLRNTRLTAADLVRWVTTGRTDATRLGLVGSDPSWRSRPELRDALLRHRDTPRGIALSLLREAGPSVWRRVADDPGAHPLLSACARELAENAPKGRESD